MAPACASQPLAEAKIWANYETPVNGRGLYQFTFSDKNMNGRYDQVDIRFKPDEEPTSTITGEDTTQQIYSKLSRGVVTTIDSASEAPKQE